MKIRIVIAILVIGAVCGQSPGQEDSSGMPGIGDFLKVVDKATSEGQQANDWSAPIKLAAVFTILTVLPALLVMMTSFTRIVIVLGFVRRALTTQNIPPTVAIIGLAIFLTLFTMSPTFTIINAQAIKPYMGQEIDFNTACSRSSNTLKGFMLRQTRRADLTLFTNLANMKIPKQISDIPMHVAMPAFAISEFRTAFEMGCLLFIPFLLVDIVVAGILLSAGMMMLPPAIISLPFKIILFVLVDGWRILSRTLVTSFN